MEVLIIRLAAGAVYLAAGLLALAYGLVRRRRSQPPIVALSLPLGYAGATYLLITLGAGAEIITNPATILAFHISQLVLGASFLVVVLVFWRR